MPNSNTCIQLCTILVYPGVKHSVSLLSSRDECSVTEWVTPGLPRMVVHKINNKDKDTSKSKNKMKKNIQVLLDSNPHLFSAKTLDYPLGYPGIVMIFIQISNSTTI